MFAVLQGGVSQVADHLVDGAADVFFREQAGRRTSTMNFGLGAQILARTVSIQIWALRSRLEKQPTDPASAGRCHHYMRDGTLA